jgi:DNA-binding protein YbaB
MDDYSRQVDRLKGMRADLEEVTATATRPDGLVTVVVGPRGAVRDIRLDPRVYRRLDSGELAQAIMQLIGKATADVAEQTKKIMTPFMPEGVSYETALGEEGDFTAFLPQPAGPPEKAGEESSQESR